MLINLVVHDSDFSIEAPLFTLDGSVRVVFVGPPIDRGDRLTGDPLAFETFRYFAYGSNMLTRRITAKERARSATPWGTGYLVGRRLTFDKLGRDGSGKCDAELTGRNSDRVYGVLYEISADDKTALDRVEGLGRGYKEERIEVVAHVGAVTAITYIATQKERLLRPFHWYKAVTVAGALEHGLPVDYVKRLRAVESVEDPDHKRRTKNESLLVIG